MGSNAYNCTLHGLGNNFIIAWTWLSLTQKKMYKLIFQSSVACTYFEFWYMLLLYWHYFLRCTCYLLYFDRFMRLFCSILHLLVCWNFARSSFYCCFARIYIPCLNYLFYQFKSHIITTNSYLKHINYET